MLKTHTFLIFLLIAVVLTVAGCGGERGSTFFNQGPGQGQNPSFRTLYDQVIGPKCSVPGCHDGNGIALPRSIDLTTRAKAYAAWVNIDSVEQPNLKRILPGDPDNSYVFHKLRDGQMPPGAPLDQNTVALFRQWILEGALDN